MAAKSPHPLACPCEFCRDKLPFEIPDDLYENFVTGNVVLFVGAGVSTETRGLFPFKLYDDICDELGMSPTTAVPFPDVMSTYCAKPNGRANLLRKIKDRLDYVISFPTLYRQATAFHRELSTIPLWRTLSQQTGIPTSSTSAEPLPSSPRKISHLPKSLVGKSLRYMVRLTVTAP
jgi:hypothetical protein